MASTLMSQDCGAACKEEAEFSVKFVIKSLTVTDAEQSSGYTDVLIVISFDGNVIKIGDIEEKDDGEMKPIGRLLDLQLSPEKFSEKLRRCPIMIELSRECTELGTVKVEVTDCFVDAVKCEEFNSESRSFDLKFVTENAENAIMSMVLAVSRVAEDPVMHSMHQNSKLKVKKKPKSKQTRNVRGSDKSSSNCDKLSSSFEGDSDMSLTCDTDLCPCEEQSEERGSSSKSKSIRSRCCSDIAPSINIQDFCDSKGTTCIGCGGISISGVTCDNKALLGLQSNSDCSVPRCVISPSPSDLSSSKVDPPHVKTPCKSPCKSRSRKPCKSASKARICSQCFDDLSVLPKGRPCPKCTARAQQELKLVSFKGNAVKKNENHKIRGCIKSIFEEIFLETKERLMDDWQRLNREAKKKPKRACKKNVRARNPSGIKSIPRCSKLLRAQGQFHHTKSAGLRKKHPGVLVGHHDCQPNGSLVPKNMGWLWNVGVSRKGWKPGAVDNTVAKIMRNHLTAPPEPTPCPVKKEPPTLQVIRKNGEYTIVMNPLLDGSDLMDDPSPIVFQISKTDDAKKRAMARNLLKLKGFKKKCDCCCIDKCECMNVCKKAQLKYELNKVSCDLELEHEMTFVDLNESGESEIDFEYTPPYAVKSKNPCVKPCKPVKVSVAETQYELQADENPVEDKKGKEKDDKEKSRKKKVPKVEVTKKKQQIVKMMRDIPKKKWVNLCTMPCDMPCAMPCDIIDDATENHRFTTNYNPINAQCPPQPPPCVNRSHMTHEIHQNPFWC